MFFLHPVIPFGFELQGEVFVTAQDDLQVFTEQTRLTFVSVEAKAVGTKKFNGLNWTAVSPQVVAPLDALLARGCNPAHCVLSNLQHTWLFRLKLDGSGAVRWDVSGPFEGKDMFTRSLLYACRKGATQYEQAQ